MHELAITESMVAAVAEAVGVARVARVHLQVSKIARIFCSTVSLRNTDGSCVR